MAAEQGAETGLRRRFRAGMRHLGRRARADSSPAPQRSSVADRWASAVDDPLVRLLNDQSLWADPYAIYDEIRPRGSIYRVGETVMYVASGHEAVSEVLRHDRVVVDPVIDDPDLPGVGSGSLIRKNPPRHGELRRLLGERFGPGHVRALGEQIQHACNGLLDDALRRGRLDVVQDYALPVTLGVIARIIGIPADYDDRFRVNGDALARALDIYLTPDQWAETRSAARELAAYFSTLIDERRQHPQDDLLTALLSAQHSDIALTDLELMANAEFVLLAGYETTVGMISSGVSFLLDQPELWRTLSAEPDLVPNFVEETLRLESPVQFTKRSTTADMQVAGLGVPAGSPVITLLGAANRDPGVFPEPTRFDVRRPNANRHVAFVVGAHHCLGSALARLEGQIAIRTLVDRLASIERSGDPTRRPNLIARGWTQVPVVVRSR